MDSLPIGIDVDSRKGLFPRNFFRVDLRLCGTTQPLLSGETVLGHIAGGISI